MKFVFGFGDDFFGTGFFLRDDTVGAGRFAFDAAFGFAFAFAFAVVFFAG